MGILNRKKFHGPRSIGSFEDFVKVMNNDFNILDDLEFSTPTLPEEIYNRCSLQIGINSKFHYLFGVCLYLGIGIEINIREATLAFYSAIMENRALPKNMFNNAVWALLKIARDLGIRNINYDLFNKITLGKCDYYYSQISRLKAGYPEKDFAKLADDIANNQNIKSIDKNILLARFFHVMFLGGREYSKDMPFDDRAAYHYDLAIEEGSEFALVCKEELFGDIAHEMKFRMLRGYSFAYNRYSSWLKGKDKFDLSDEEQYNFCLNSARLGNEVAIRDFYEWFYGKKSGEAFFSSLMNFLFEQGFKRGCRGLIQLQEQILLENKSDLKKLYKTKHKELAKKDKELAELSDYVDYLLTKIVEQYSQDKD